MHHSQLTKKPEILLTGYKKILSMDEEGESEYQFTFVANHKLC
jgi:hypothetical protein